MKNFTIEKTHQGLKNKDFSCQELVQDFLDSIRKDKLNDFISLFEAEALKKAKLIDQKIDKGEELKRLEGIPVAIKDNILISGTKTTAGSKMLENYIAPYNAEVIDKLEKAGVIFLGKTNLDEFAMGASNETSAFGPVLNPHDKTRVPGGSSGGSAVAVAAKHCVFALGSDTGGSIRQPAAFCGVVGYKPSYGLISRRGLISLASSLDQIGPLTNSVEDAVKVVNVIAGHDQKDMTSRQTNLFNLKEIRSSISDYTIGFPQDYYDLSIDLDIKNNFKDLLGIFKEDNIKLKKIDLSFLEVALAIYYILQPAEASTNLARYDGLRYGLNIEESKDLLDNYLENRSRGFGAEVKRRIMIGTYVLSAGYKDAYYNMARKVQEDIKSKFNQIFKKVDVIVLPTTPSKAFKLGEKFNDPLTMYLSDIFTVATNIAGLPGISIPIIKKNSLPVGLQIWGDFDQDQKVLQTAYQVEKILNKF